MCFAPLHSFFGVVLDEDLVATLSREEEVLEETMMVHVTDYLLLRG